MKTKGLFLLAMALNWIACGEIQAVEKLAQNLQLTQTIAPLSASNHASGDIVSAPGAQPVDPESVPRTTTISFKLKPTAIAPVGAAGSAQIKSRMLAVHLSGLGPGRYDVDAISRPAETRLRLGTLTIVDPTHSPDRQATDNKKEASADPDQVRVDTDVQIKLTGELTPQSLDRLELRDEGGNSVLTGKAETISPLQ